MHIWDHFGQLLFTLSTMHTNRSFKTLPPEGTIACDVLEIPLVEGAYRVSLWCKVDGVLADRIEDAMHFAVVGGDYYKTGKMPEKRHHGSFLVRHDWSLEQQY